MSRGGIRKDTNSNNPNAIKARVFVGNLNNEQCTQEELDKTFSQHGKITGCSVHKNFGFVQFETEKSAREMVAEWNGKNFAGKRIDCNIADERRKPQQKDFHGNPIPPPARQRTRSPPRNRPPSPRHRVRSRSPRGRDRDRPSPGMFGRREDRPSRFSGGRPGDESHNTRYPPAERHEGGYRRSREPYDGPPRESFDRRGYSYGSSFPAPAPQGESYGNESYTDQPAPFMRPRVDCEIIVLSKEQRRYGEDVEERLRRIGVVSNLTFPRPDIRVVDVIERVAKSGSLYSIVLSAQNEMHHSCTLNIMHGTRQEHRNMPLEDALAFVAKHFEQYLRELEGDQGAGYATDFMPPTLAAPSPSIEKKDNIAELLVAAAAGKTLDNEQIARLANELKKRNAGSGHSSSGQVSSHEKADHLQSLVLKTLGHPTDASGSSRNEAADRSSMGVSSSLSENHSSYGYGMQHGYGSNNRFGDSSGYGF